MSDIFAGYEAKRDALRIWFARHYVAEFGLTPGSRVLDVGCGNGFWASLFAEAGFEVRGFDVERGYIEEAKAKYPGIQFSIADASKAHPAMGKFDVVFARTLPQFFQPTLEPLAAMVRVLLKQLEPDGILLLSAYTDGSGTARPLSVGGFAHHHKDAALLAAVHEAGGVRTRLVRTSNYVQIVAHR